MNILIANVGNVRVNEIKVLAEALNKNHRVTIVCMAMDSSFRGLAFSFQDEPVRVSPLVYKEIVKSAGWVAIQDMEKVKVQSKSKLAGFDGIAAYEFFSNPADAISIMLSDIMAHEKPDLVICGINNGIHMGQDIYSSSNIGMAMEAAFFRIPTVAVGMERQNGGHREDQMANVVKFIETNAEAFSKMKLPDNTFLNINVPTVAKYKELKGVKITRMGRMTQFSEYEEKTDARGVKYYWAKDVERLNAMSEKDIWARTWFDQKYITIVPVNYDATDYGAVDKWAKNIVGGFAE